MNGEMVADIVQNSIDLTGTTIDTVYSKVRGTYAVYRTADRVMVQFADDEALGSQQRLALSPLAPIRGEINGLIDGWRASSVAEKQAKAKLFDRRSADALTVALQGDQAHALELLKVLKADVLEERTSVARSQYVIIAAVSAVFLVALFGLLTGPWINDVVHTYVSQNKLWLGAGMGALGALFSIALGIRSRSILTDLQSRDNAVDAVLRVTIGAVSAVILYALLRGNIITFGFGGRPLNSITSNDLAIVVAFVAGFSERLVGDFLGHSTIATTTADAANPLGGGAAGRTPPPQDADEHNPLGKDTGAGDKKTAADADEEEDRAHRHDDGDEQADCCLANVELRDEELTDDIELPPASGGVEKPVNP